MSTEYLCNESPDVGDTTEVNEEIVLCTCAPAPTTDYFGLIFYPVCYDLCAINLSVAPS